jgi:hypothetical protein
MITTIISIIGQTAFYAVWALLGALFLQLSTRIVAKFKQPYGKAYIAVLLSSIGGTIVVTIFSLIATNLSGPEIALDIGYIIFSMLLGIVTQVFVLAYTIKSPEGEYLSFLQTILTAIVYNILSIIVVVTIVTILVLIVGTSIFALTGFQAPTP